MGYVYQDSIVQLQPWISRELVLAREVGIGARGDEVKRVQEWLTLQGFPVVPDGVYGVATSETVARFQAQRGLSDTGRVDAATFAQLSQPLLNALQPKLNASIPIGQAVVAYARSHLAEHPREVGGQNRGPWVRAYMRGNEGASWPWCAGFVTFLLRQATESLEVEMPIAGSTSCDSLAGQARQAGLFVAESEARYRSIPPGSIFLNRRTSTDWTHVGIVVEADGLTLTTIEGNTNDSGEREGFEVCMRTRSYDGRDFIVYDV